jgi:hypothetical protein
MLMLKRDYYIITKMNNKVAEQMKRKTLDIDIIEDIFERHCDNCKLNRGCKDCPVKGRFIQILDIEVKI